VVQPVNVGLLGLGTVGGGTLAVLRRNRDEISRRAGREIQVTRASVRDANKSRGFEPGAVVISEDSTSVVDDPEIEIVVELIGGIEPAYELVLRAINNGKHVVTANKALIALHGNEIFQAAQAKGVMVAFEAAVAGGIPAIKTLRESLAGNRIEWIAGIINGTSNYILTAMSEDARAFDDVLAEAQQLGYAEADPGFDIDGTDAAHKLTILAAIAFGIPLQFEKVYCEGIAAVVQEDIVNAGQLGYRIKHLGIARRSDSGVELRVHPTLVPARRVIANVDGVMNAVLVKGDAVGPTLLYGAGAGAEPTASSVVADLVDVTRALTSDPENRVPHLAFQPDSLSDLRILSIDEITTSYYLRMQVLDRPGVMADVTRILADRGISIEALLQKATAPDGLPVTIILLTHQVVERSMDEALADISELEAVRGEITRIRLESLE
jgi:homoserine dehydrogenase